MNPLNTISHPLPMISDLANPEISADIPVAKHARRYGLTSSAYDSNRRVFGSWMEKLNDESDDIWNAINTSLASGTLTNNDKLILDCSWEGWSYSKSSYEILHGNLERRGISPSNVSIISQNRDHHILHQEHFGVDSLKLLSFNSPMAELGHCFVDHQLKTTDLDELIMSVSVDRLLQTPNAVLCMNNIPKPHRVALCSYVDSIEAEHSLVSCAAPPANDSGFIGNCKMYASSVSIDDSALSKFITSLPRVIDQLPGSHAMRDSGTFSFFPSEHQTCFAAAISESEMSNGSPQRITEKTIKAIGMGRPFVLFGNPYSLAAIRELGFKTMHTVVNEEYDILLDRYIRFTAAADSLSTLVDLWRNPGRKDYIAELSSICEFNIRHMASGFNNMCKLYLRAVLAAAI